MKDDDSYWYVFLPVCLSHSAEPRRGVPVNRTPNTGTFRPCNVRPEYMEYSAL